MRHRMAGWFFVPCGISIALFISPVIHAEMVLYRVGGDFKGFDPIDAGDVESADQCSRVYEGLLEYHYLERPYRTIPRLAETMPEVSADGLTYTFKIKKGVRFQDDPCFPSGKGRELVAEDFIYSFKRLLNPKLESPGDWILINHLLGAQDWAKMCSETKGAVDYSKPLEGLQALDHYTLQIRLRRPYPQLFWVLTMTYAFAVPREAVEYYDKLDGFRNHPVGTGPFRLKKWRRSYRIEFERNPTFYGQLYPDKGEPGDREAGLLDDVGKPLPLLDRIVEYEVREYYTSWQMFLRGQINSSGISKDYFEKVISPDLGLSPLLKKKGIRLYKSPEMVLYYIGFNMRDPIVGNLSDPDEELRHKKLRQAFATAIDVDKFNEVITNNRAIAANSPIPPEVPGHTDKPYPYKFNRERAKQLLLEAGYPGGRDKDGRPLRLTMVIMGAGEPLVRQIADFFIEHERAIGIELVIQQLTFTEYLRRTHEGATQIYYAGWVIDYPDAQNFLQLFYGPNKCPGINYSNYENREFDRLYARILTMPDTPERTALYEQMADITVEDCVCALVNYPLAFGLYHSWFQNYKPHDFPYANWKYYKVTPH